MIDFHTHPLLVQEMFEREPDLHRIAREVFYIRNRPQPLETFLLGVGRLRPGPSGAVAH